MDGPKPKEPQSIAQVSKEMAIRKTIAAIKSRQNKAQQPEVPKPEEGKKKQIENDFVPEPTPDA